MTGEIMLGYIVAAPGSEPSIVEMEKMMAIGISKENIFVDMDPKPHPMMRPEFKRMVSRLSESPKPTGVYFGSVLRLWRSPRESLDVLVPIERNGVAIRTIMEEGIESLFNDIAAHQPHALRLLVYGCEIEAIWRKNLQTAGIESARGIESAWGRPRKKVDVAEVMAWMRKNGTTEEAAIAHFGYNRATYYNRKREVTGTIYSRTPTGD